MTVSEQSASMSAAYSVDVGGLSVMTRGNHAGTGSASVTVHGASLGLVAMTAMGRIGHTGCEGTEWESETSVRCLMGHGSRGTRRVSITMEQKSGCMSGAYSVEMASLRVSRRVNHGKTG